MGAAGGGIVKYESAHIDGVASELIVRFGHSVQGHPKAIEEVRRILIDHLNDLEVVGSGDEKNARVISLQKNLPISK